MKKIIIKAEAGTIERLVEILKYIIEDIEGGLKICSYTGNKIEYEFKIEKQNGSKNFRIKNSIREC